MFFFLELDNNTASVDRYRKKLSGYVAYRQERRFLDTLARYIRKYHLPISQPTNAFRVLTVTPDEQRRNLLFHDALKLASFKLLWFVALSEITADTILSPLWLRGKEYASIAEQEKTLATELTAAKHTQWVHAKLAQMPRLGLLNG